MANLLTSSQTQATSAPAFYTDYLSNLASQGQAAASQAQFAGAQPLQQQAFEQVGEAGKTYQPTLEQAQNVLGRAAEAPTPLSVGTKYLEQAAQGPGALAMGLMSPYAKTAAQGLSDIAQRNIQQNLAPMATAASVGSGQFGSQRGAQVLGGVERQAEQDLNTQIAQMMNQGYGQALTAAGQQQQLLGNLGATAGQQASAGQQNLGNIGQQLGALAGTTQNLSLADINALATLGGQQQTIAQNQQNYPLTKLANLAALLQGQQIPSTVTTELNMSPLSAIGAIGSGIAGLFQGTGTNATGPSLWQQMTGTGTGGANTSIWNQIKSALPGGNTTPVTPSVTGGGDYTGGIANNSTFAGTNANGTDVYYNPSNGQYTDSNGLPVDITGMEGE